MELSSDFQNCSKQISCVSNEINRGIHEKGQGLFNSCLDILDISDINLEDEECWLYETTPKNDKPVSIFSFLYDEATSAIANGEYKGPQISSKAQKALDTRTFTRPRKKLARPTLEQLEQLYSSSNSDVTELNSSTEGLKKSDDSGVFINEFGMEKREIYTPSKPLQFDLSQPTSSFYLENMIRSTDLDSFQNMSPPSLVNSLCSSTFANLMESSFIRNDPILREIRDTDFTETVLLQDTEAPLFQSISGSCSSINSDSPENFLKKVSYNGTFRRSTRLRNKTLDINEDVNNSSSASSTKEDNCILNETITLDNNINKSTEEIIDAKVNQSFTGNVNGTYRRSPRINRKTDPRYATITINNTFDLLRDNISEKSLNSSKCSTETVVLQSGPTPNITNNTESSDKSVPERYSFILHNHDDSGLVESMKKRYSDQSIPALDLNKLSYFEGKNTKNSNEATFVSESNNDVHRTADIKRSSLGSADSLDRLSSSLSNSSKGSNKMLNMAEVDAIVEMQERSLNQVMSTPKPNTKQVNTKTIFGSHFISPIVNTAHLSDSDVSSNEDFKSAKSNFSSKTSLDPFSKQTAKSLGYLGPNIDTKLKPTLRNNFTLSNQNGKNPLQSIADNIRGSYGNLKSSQVRNSGSNIGGSYSNIYRPNNAFRPGSTVQQSNLNTMETKLKGSYTSLRPISAVLPVAPPVGSDAVNTTVTIVKSRAKASNVTQVMDSRPKVAQVAPVVKEQCVPVAAGDSTFVRPQISRTSALPRPTGIPRPASSKIPAPRISSLRPSSTRNKKQNDYCY